MNSLILISLSICDFVEILSLTATYEDCFMFAFIFMLLIFINKNSAMNKNNRPEVLV